MTAIDNDQPNQGSDPAVLWNFFQAPSLNLIYNTLEMGDLNLDGNLDIVVGYDGQGILLWLGDGNGGWQNITNRPATSGNYNDICIGDINNDGKPDIVGARQGGLSVWFGDGTGSAWGANTGPTATGTFNAIILDDVNLDSNLDIVSAATGSGVRKGVQVYLGNGLGVWSNGDTNLPLSTTYNGIFTGDFNHDGKPDIVAAGSIGVDAWTGNGAGTWTLSDSGLASLGTFSDVELSDLDHDSNLDIVATGGNNNGVMAWKGNGAGFWVVSFNLPLTGTYTGIEICDVNIDGYMDIITTSTNTNQVVWTGDGTFNWYLQISGLPSGNSYSDISIGDVDIDGHLDICIAKSSAGIEIYTSTAQRYVNKWTSFASPIFAETVNDIEVFDVNLDGKLDICYATQSSGLLIWTGNGAGTWASFTSPVTTGTVYAVSSTDYNNDGKPDLVATQNNGVRAWRGNGLGTWVLNSVSSTGVWYGLAVADFNDDGFMDISAGSGANGGLFVWNGNGAGTWTIKFNLPLTGTYPQLDVADVNKDGAIDLLATDGGLRVFLGNANDGWTESSTGLPGISSQYKSVKAVDLNNNGIVDIVGASEANGANTWSGNGAGQWTAGTNIVATQARGISINDFSIDGKADVCTGSSQNTGPKANKNTGNGWASTSGGLPPTGSYISLELADINIDGRLDIITYNNTGLNSKIWTGDYEAPALSSFSIGPLVVGWNLVSSPLIPTNSSMPGTLMDIDGDTIWTNVKYCNPTDAADPWKSYRTGRPLNMQDLTAIDEKMGVWVYIPDTASLGDSFIRVQGTPPSSTVISLKTGWNLVGYPSSQTRIASNTLPGQADIVSVYQATSPYISDHSLLSSVNLEQGHAYWVRVTSDCTWTVSY